MKIEKVFLLLISAIFVLTACSRNNEPPVDKLKAAFILQASDLLDVVTVDEFEVEVSDNIGTKVEPEIKSRIAGVLITKEAFYKRVDYVDDMAVVTQVTPKGFSMPISVIATSTLSAGKWNVEFSNMQFGKRPEGFPLSDYNEYLIEGSQEHKKLLAEKKAEQERLAKERAEAEKKKLAEFNEFRKSITGAWVGEKPIISKGKYTDVSIKGNKYNLHYKISIPEGDNFSGIATVTFFTEPQTRTIPIDAQFQMSDTPYFILNELEKMKIGDSYRDYWKSGDEWLFEVDGNVMNGKVTSSRHSYTTTLHKETGR